ncbi:actin-like ATPase domain-containing protein [Neofusicoccum parvum]|uniref:Actin-like ATPase domain-containing protein n=1 Tax=Neofusicoccum parvum TaxID=310453 RepID=A0ACB5SMV7_9PEZI|nr:actin-like ATPase domain-containing protein [Neofusicoccum parvum]
MSSKKLFSLPFRTSNQPDDKLSKAASTTTNKPSTPAKVNSASPPTTPDRLIVGVDFGTTYSGVAACYSGTPDDIDIIKSSDASDTEGAEKPQAKIKWGFQLGPSDPRLRCIKLFLDRGQKLPHFVSPLDTAVQLRKYDKTVMDAVADYLTQIRTHTNEILTRRHGEAFMASTPTQFVLTVPAVWSDAAKDATLKAAERAGMGSRESGGLKLISEPEAAAVYTLKAIQPNHLSVGDNFIVCDAGGGTVDLIAYKITQLSPLLVEESAIGTGGLCGSAFLNYRFEDHVKARLGDERYTEMRTKKQKTWNMGLRYFEEFVKRNFNPDAHVEINVPFPGLPDDEEAGLDCGFMTMTAAQVQEIFDPVVQDVIALVDGQVTSLRARGERVSGVVLVGGFGQSDHLYLRMKAHFNAAAPPPPYEERPTHAVAVAGTQANQAVQVMHPMYAWTAVVRGAVLRGLEGSMVVSRRSRCHYGTSYATVFDEAKHSVAERYWSPLWERWMVSDRMQWHIRKDEQLSDSAPVSFHYTRNFRPGQSLVVEDDLIACDWDEAPESYKKGLVSVCTLTTDLSRVPRSLFTRLTTSKGVEFDNLDFSLDMRVESAGLVFELCVDGVGYGRVEARFH